MFGFSKTFSGLYIGAKVIRAVKGRMGTGRQLAPAISGYAEQALPEGVLLPSYARQNIAEMKKFKDILRLTLGTAGIMKGDISVSIPEQVVKVSFLELKGVSAKREEVLKFIKWRAKKFLPYDPESAKIDYQVFGDRALAVFINGVVVADYEEALNDLSLRPGFVSIPSMNLFNLFAARFGDYKEFALISVMEDFFALMVIRNGAIDFYRSTEVGYLDDRLLQEINSSILFYTAENPDVAIKKVFLYAGTGDSDILATHLSDSTGMEVETMKLSEAVRGPGGVDIEPYGPAIAAAVGSK